MSEKPRIDPVRPTDDEARRAVATIVRKARFGSLASLDPASGWPVSTRVACATDLAGNPLILVSSLTPHTAAMLADPRVSLLLGEPGKGDPLAHPRVTLQCKARKLDRETDENGHARRRYLNRHPKAGLYADFGDFAFFVLELDSASFNGGFGKAYRLSAADILVTGADMAGFADIEQSAISHMNNDHRDAVGAIAAAWARGGANWHVTGIDPAGMDLAHGDAAGRAWFDGALQNAGQLRTALADMAAAARQKTASG